MENLDTVLPKNERTLGTEDVDNHIDVCRRRRSREVHSARLHRRRGRGPSGITTVRSVNTRRAAPTADRSGRRRQPERRG